MILEVRQKDDKDGEGQTVSGIEKFLLSLSRISNIFVWNFPRLILFSYLLSIQIDVFDTLFSEPFLNAEFAFYNLVLDIIDTSKYVNKQK